MARALLIPFKPQDPTDVVSQYLDIFLRGQVNAGRTVVVLVDEAQGLMDSQYEELRFLTNLEHKNKKLVEIVLAGLPSLERKLKTPDLEALNQRATVRCWVEPLDLEHTYAYVRHRLQVVGASNLAMVSTAAVERIHHASRGIPRLINIVCERALLVGYVDEVQLLDAPQIDQAVADLNLKPIGEGSDQHTGGLSFEANLLLRMAGQIDAIKKKVDDIEARIETGALTVQAATTKNVPRLQRWLKSLRESPLTPSTDTEALEDLVESPFAAATPIKANKRETNH